jgi:hypothetical protein
MIFLFTDHVSRHNDPMLPPMEDYQEILPARHSDDITSALLSDWPLLPLLMRHSHVSLPHLKDLPLTNRFKLCDTFLDRLANRGDIYAPSCP